MGFILNSRPVEHRARFHAAVTAALADAAGDWRIVDCPVLTAEPVTVRLPPAGGFDVVIFTSQIAAALFPVSSAWDGKKVLAVGEATAATARAQGFGHVIDTGKDVADLRTALARIAFGQALYPCAEDIAADLAAEFPSRVQSAVTYRMVPRTGLDLDGLAPGWRTAPVLAPLFSRRSAETLAGLLAKALAERPDQSNPDQSNIAAIAISADAMVDGPWTSRTVAGVPTLAGVAEAAAGVARAITTKKTEDHQP